MAGCSFGDGWKSNHILLCPIGCVRKRQFNPWVSWFVSVLCFVSNSSKWNQFKGGLISESFHFGSNSNKIKILSISSLGGIQQLRGQNFGTFLPSPLCEQFLYRERGQKQTFFDPLPPHLGHVVFECPLMYKWQVYFTPTPYLIQRVLNCLVLSALPK